MSPSVYIEDILNGKVPVGTEVTLNGWVYNSRSSGKVKFLMLRDGTGTLQTVFF